MTTTFDLHEAKTQLSKLVELAGAGEGIGIAARRLPRGLVQP
jgi:antitoxin (DNA-binding transcriptional repressor) of toxin-antitoxin stability system